LDIITQDTGVWLVDEHNSGSKFKLKPDILIRSDNNLVVADTKWKIIDQNATNKNYMISQSDMYQLFAYGKKYGAKYSKPTNLMLIYPLSETFSKKLEFVYCNNGDTLVLHAEPFDIKESFGNDDLLKDSIDELMSIRPYDKVCQN